MTEKFDISFLKKEARTLAFARRKAAFEASSVEQTESVKKVVLELAKSHDAISIYMPIRTEFDPLPSMHALHEAQKHVAIPVVMGEKRPLNMVKWTPELELIKGEFGALIPRVAENLTPTLVIAPLVAYDAIGTRLGYGGGFYDRTIEKLRTSGDCAYWGLAYSNQFSAINLPREKTDIKLDGIITEKEFYRFFKPKASNSIV